MNLIEQLGGYGRLKGYMDGALKGMPDSYCYKFNTVLGRQKLLNMSDVKSLLLKYRRQHNIYEAGDLVVHDAHIGDEIYEFISLLEDIGMATVKSKHMTGGCSLRGLRHATPEEIKAGRRL